jgi:hypothetical protein
LSDAFVELTTVSQRVFAEPLLSMLNDNGIAARASADDCGGVDPSLAFTRGVGVLVPTADLARAKELLTDFDTAEFQLPPELAEDPDE